MAGKPRENKTTPLNVTISEQTKQFLEAIAKNGGYFGTTAPEVARSFIEDRVAELVQSGFLDQGEKALSKVNDILGRAAQQSSEEE